MTDLQGVLKNTLEPARLSEELTAKKATQTRLELARPKPSAFEADPLTTLALCPRDLAIQPIVQPLNQNASFFL